MLPKSKVSLNLDIVKIAIEFGSQIPQLFEFDQRQSLNEIIQNLCNNWIIADGDNYALKFSEDNNKNYVTETNRYNVRNGTVLVLTLSPSKTTNDILKILQFEADINEKTECIKRLATLSSDITFASEFIKESGLNILINMIEDEQYNSILDYTLQSFVELMKHDTVSWNILESTFINKNIEFINQPTSRSVIIIQSALSILNNILRNSVKSALVEQNVTFDNLLQLLEIQNKTVQLNTIALINSLFQKTDETGRRIIDGELRKTETRDIIISNVLNNEIESEMAHQLYVLQTLILGLLEERMLSMVVTRDHLAYEHNEHKNSISEDDFIEIPPGMLALDCMTYFASNYTWIYKKIIYENGGRTEDYKCSFDRTSIELVKLLCDILNIGESPSEQGQNFYPMFFTHDHPFEELFSICIEVLNNTWKDMRATNEQFANVLVIVRQQITMSLNEKSKNFTDFRATIKSLTYSALTAIDRKKRISNEESKFTSSAIVKLKEKLTPEILELIKLQRLRYLADGTQFVKYSRDNKNKDTFWFIRLSANHKHFYYSDCNENFKPSLKALINEINVIDIRQLLVGKECPQIKSKSKIDVNLRFSLIIDNGENTTLDFVAPDETIFNYWTDGINALLGQPMVSKQQEEDFENLISMEIQIRLLDTDRIDFSCKTPPIPDDPENYDFDS